MKKLLLSVMIVMTCFVTDAYAQRGCCSWHGGVSSCSIRELSVKREDELKRLLKKNNIDFYDEDEENINALEEAATQLKNLRKTLKKNKEADKVKDDKDEVTSVSEETKQSE